MVTATENVRYIMSDKEKSRREKVLGNLLSYMAGTPQEQTNTKDLISSLASLAGKGKDEVVQILCREIGLATAAIWKEPLAQILENRKLQITFEFVPKADEEPKSKPSSKKKSKKKKTTKKKY